jgi:lipopolysaccharide transport system ATP-binding protein
MHMQPAVSIENLSKMYRLGAGHQGSYKTLRESLVGAASAPFRRRKAIRNSASNGSEQYLLQNQNGHHAQNGGAVLEKPEDAETLWALNDVSFDVQHGEVVGIIGRNGAGKSTLLKILSRITEPTSGRVVLNGRVASLLEVGTGFHPELSGRENIYLNGAILGMHRHEIKRKFDAMVDFSGVEKFLDTPVKRYSSGMYVRLAFAVAAHLEPEILIVDEVLAVGDAEFQKKCLGKMQEVARQGRTVLFVSHNMAAVRGLCGRAIWLDSGKLKLSGPVFDTIDAYLESHLGSSGSILELANHPRSQRDGTRLRICRVVINEGEPVAHGDDLQMDFEFETFSSLEQVSFAFGMSHTDGSRILTVDSDVSGTTYSSVEENRSVARCTLKEFALEPGTYSLDIGARSGSELSLDHLANCALVTVVPGKSTPAVIAMRNGRSGGVRLNADWR